MIWNTQFISQSLIGNLTTQTLILSFFFFCHDVGEQMCVRLEKNDRDLGFSLEGGVGSSLENRPLTVQKVFQGNNWGQMFILS